MKTLYTIRKKVLNILGYQNILKNNIYVDNPYVITHTVKDKTLICNLLTGEFISIDEDEKLSEEFLISHWYKIDSSLDPSTLSTVLNDLNIKKETTKTYGYIIFTAMECNANCEYCFESGYRHGVMSEETAKQTAKYIISNNTGSLCKLHWFGGEPLVNVNAIDTITKELLNSNITYESEITTNGYLIDKISKYKLLHLWKVKKVQITIDADSEEYKNIKRYKNNDPDPLKKVIDNIFLLSKYGIKVSVRTNTSESNLNSVKNAINKIISDERYNDNISFYSHRIFIPDQSEDIQKKINENDVQFKKYLMSISKYNFNPMSFEKKPNYCFADYGSSEVILIDGHITRCEHFYKSNFIGSVFSNQKNISELCKYVVPLRRMDRCKNCPLLPCCVKSDFCPALNSCTEDEIDYNIHCLKLDLECKYKEKIKEGLEEIYVIS